MRKLRLFLISAILAFVSGQNLFAQGLEDITSKLKNPALDSKDGWTFIKEGTKDWSNIAGAAPFNVVEAYAGWGELGEITTFTMKQDVTLDAGTYRFVSQSFHRGDVGGAKVFAKVGETVKEVDVAKINQFLKWPDNVDQASKAFATNAYLNVVEFTVESNSTVVTLGIDGEHKAKQEWFIAGPCKLYAVKNEVSSTYPLDVTHMVNRANTAIEGVSGTYESNVWVHEKYSETPFPVGDIMSTAITGLENGTYQVEIYAAASSAWGKSSVPAEKPYLYANDVKVDVTATETNGVNPVPVFTLDNVVVSDGTLNLGFSNRAEGSNWNLFYIKSIKMVAPAAPAYTEVANIADVKKLANGTEFKLTLKDAKVTVQTFSMRGMMILLEDATGAIDVSELSALEGFVEQNIINGTLYGVYRNEFGTIGLGLSENTEKSEITVQPGVVTPTKFTIADVKNEANYYKFVELNDCKAVYDEENYTWWAFVGTDSIAITDRFNKTVNWETGEQEIPANIKSMTGIIMFDGEKWVICPYAYGENKAIVAEPQPEDIVVNVAEGEIAAAVEAEKAKVAKVGNITVNLTAGAAYTITNTIEIPAGFILNGNGATIDATGLGAKMIQAPAGDLAEWATIDSVAVKDVTIKGLARELFYSNAKNRNYVNFVVENSVIELTGDKTTFDFTKGSVAMNFLVKNSTIYAPTATTKSLYSSQSAQKGSDAGATVEAPQVFAFENTTLYNLAPSKNLFTHRSASQSWMKFVVKNNVVVNTGKSNFMTTINQGQDNKNPQYDVTVNSVGTLADGVYTDQSAAQVVQSNVMGELITTDPGFANVAAGDFTLSAESEQAVKALGDARWIPVVGPTEPVVELTHTASSYCETDANAYVSTVDAEKEHVNNSKFSGTWQGAAYADFSITLPAGHSIKSASLAWAGIGSSKDRTTDIMYVNAGEQLDYAAFAAGNAKVNLPATYIATVTFKKSATTSFTTDVTDAVKTIIESGQKNVIFKFTNNVGAGDIVGKGAAEKAPVLTIETVSAADMTKYTVVAMVDADTVKVVSYDGVVGETATASAEDMAAFKNEDGSKKYIYVGGNSEITLVNDSASNIINLVFREAEKYRYSVVAKNGDGEMMQTLTNGQDFEGETIKVPYSRYILNYSDSTLYAADATNKEYNKSLTINEDGATLNITYKKTEINNVIALSEAEDVWGLTPITTGNASIRSSQSAAAYAAEEDVEVAYLTTGKYKMAAIIYDASKNLNSTFTFGIANDTILKATSTTANWTECVSDEFTVLGSNVPVVLHKGGSEIRGVDFFFIQKTGGVPAVAVANIAEAKKQKNGTPIKLTLNDAKVTVQTYAMTGTFVALEDASGAIQLSSNMALEGITEQNALNGELYVSFVDQNGAMQLDLSDSTQYSQFTATPSTFTPAEIKYSEVKDSANLYRFVKLGACKTIFDEEMYMYYAISGKDTIPVIDRFMNMQTWMGYATEVPEQVEYMTGVVMHNGEEFCFYPYAYGEDKAIVGVAQPEDIVVNVTEGEISAAVEAEKAKVAKVGNITVNLTEGVEYTLASPIVAGAGGIVINGNKSVITTSAELITLPAEPTVAANEAKAGFYEITSPIVIENVHVKAAKAIVKSKAKYLVSAININNSIIEMTAQSAVVDFSGGQMGYPTVLSVNNSTVWSAQNTNKPFFTSQSGNSPKDINNAAEEKQTISIENSTFYNIAYNKNFNELRQKGQKFLVFTIKNNIIVNSGKANFLQGMDGGQSSANPTWTVENNTFGTLVDGAFTDVSASQSGCGEVVNSVVTNPGFKDVAAGDFTVYAGSEQAKQKIGDPRWLVEFDENLTGIDGINAAATLNGAVYTINGIKVREAGETLKGLSKGMYIINGKKYVVK